MSGCSYCKLNLIALLTGMVYGVRELNIKVIAMTETPENKKERGKHK